MMNGFKLNGKQHVRPFGPGPLSPNLVGAAPGQLEACKGRLIGRLHSNQPCYQVSLTWLLHGTCLHSWQDSVFSQP